jgi:hypothetical protein
VAALDWRGVYDYQIPIEWVGRDRMVGAAEINENLKIFGNFLI